MNDTIQKIKKAISRALPKNQSFTLLAEATGIGESEVLRVITPAWKSLDRMERILRVQNAVMPVLNDEERSKIFRFSVLTAAEWKSARLAMPRSSAKVLARKKAFIAGS